MQNQKIAIFLVYQLCGTEIYNYCNLFLKHFQYFPKQIDNFTKKFDSDSCFHIKLISFINLELFGELIYNIIKQLYNFLIKNNYFLSLSINPHLIQLMAFNKFLFNQINTLQKLIFLMD